MSPLPDFDPLFRRQVELVTRLDTEGLDKGIFYRNEDGSVWADLSSEGLDRKLLLRADGTSTFFNNPVSAMSQQELTDRVRALS